VADEGIVAVVPLQDSVVIPVARAAEDTQLDPVVTAHVKRGEIALGDLHMLKGWEGLEHQIRVERRDRGGKLYTLMWCPAVCGIVQRCVAGQLDP
jgi:hypothetical protein